MTLHSQITAEENILFQETYEYIQNKIKLKHQYNLDKR